MTDRKTQSNDNQKDNMVMSHLTMRFVLGLLGSLLPFILLTESLLTEFCLRDSISSFYYSPSVFLHGLFVGILCAIGVFLVCYVGYEKEEDEHISDDLVASLAGFSIILVAIFPVVSWSPDIETIIRLILHYGSAGLFFLAVGFMSFFKFTRPPGSDKTSAQKRRSNRIYRYCARGIFIFIILILLKCPLESLFNYDLDRLNWVFWLESFAVWAFGISWLVKGEALERFLRKNN